MKIIDNVLSDSLLSECNDELRSNFIKNTWISSWFAWPKDVRMGVSGNCLISHVSSELSDKVKDEINNYFSNQNYGMVFQVFQPYSGLSSHTDTNYGFSATIYLNDFWDAEWGGWFIWSDKNTEEYRAFLPKENTMILSTDYEKHLVTPVSPHCGQFRCTIQIRGK